nr:DUF6295 family protein [Mycobacterium gastri]
MRSFPSTGRHTARRRRWTVGAASTSSSLRTDHPVHARYGHTVNIDVINPELGPSARVALELTEESALALADAIRKAIAHAPAGLASRNQ